MGYDRSSYHVKQGAHDWRLLLLLFLFGFHGIQTAWVSILRKTETSDTSRWSPCGRHTTRWGQTPLGSLVLWNISVYWKWKLSPFSKPHSQRRKYWNQLRMLRNTQICLFVAILVADCAKMLTKSTETRSYTSNWTNPIFYWFSACQASQIKIFNRWRRLSMACVYWAYGSILEFEDHYQH